MTNIETIMQITHRNAFGRNPVLMQTVLNKEVRRMPGGGGTHLPSQHLRGRGRWISVSLSPVWSTDRASGQPEMYRETLASKTQNKKKEVRKDGDHLD